MEAIARENSKMTAPGSNGKLTNANARAKKVVVLELHEIALIASLDQINNIGSNRARKFKKECTWEQRQIEEHERSREKGSCLRIA